MYPSRGGPTRGRHLRKRTDRDRRWEVESEDLSVGDILLLLLLLGADSACATAHRDSLADVNPLTHAHLQPRKRAFTPCSLPARPIPPPRQLALAANFLDPATLRSHARTCPQPSVPRQLCSTAVSRGFAPSRSHACAQVPPRRPPSRRTPRPLQHHFASQPCPQDACNALPIGTYRHLPLAVARRLSRYRARVPAHRTLLPSRGRPGDARRSTDRVLCEPSRNNLRRN